MTSWASALPRTCELRSKAEPEPTDLRSRAQKADSSATYHVCCLPAVSRWAETNRDVRTTPSPDLCPRADTDPEDTIIHGNDRAKPESR